MVIRRPGKRSQWRAAVLGGALSAATGIAVPDAVFAQGLFDFLFGGGFEQRPPPPVANSHLPPSAGAGRIAPASLGQESVNGGGAGAGHSVAFCVRLCDGQHFPMEHVVNGDPAESCRMACPHSKTKVFFGGEIAGAVARDGEHYANLQAAFAYRKQIVPNCTCNGKDAFGLTSSDVKNDPSLRPGDIVSTKDGLLAYVGKSGQLPSFTPVNPAALPVDIRPGTPQQRFPTTVEPADDDPGAIVPPGRRLPENAPPVVNSPRPAR